MKTIQISAVNRGDFGKKATKAVRREGLIPCVLYGGGENVAFAIEFAIAWTAATFCS